MHYKSCSNASGKFLYCHMLLYYLLAFMSQVSWCEISHGKPRQVLANFILLVR